MVPKEPYVRRQHPTAAGCSGYVPGNCKRGLLVPSVTVLVAAYRAGVWRKTATVKRPNDEDDGLTGNLYITDGIDCSDQGAAAHGLLAAFSEPVLGHYFPSGFKSTPRELSQ